ncbi:MAG TPA: Crp/Fnr family transcriptional regulator [Firmicutes bacterium]|nr:Crp/Fnr family transcriptional regulator [Bacillota bacterium]
MDDAFLLRTPLFQGLSSTQLQAALPMLNARQRAYRKHESILHAGDHTTQMGLVLSGGVRIEHDDAWGGKSIFSFVEPGEMFAETYACLPDQTLMVTAVAAQDSRVLFLDAQRLIAGARSDAGVNLMVGNLLRVSIRKNLELSRRMLHTSAKTIRGRLLSYLSERALLAGGRRFSIPFNRQQLADYLGVDRSALSHELSKMRRDGLLSCQRNTFILHGPPPQ